VKRQRKTVRVKGITQTVAPIRRIDPHRLFLPYLYAPPIYTIQPLLIPILTIPSPPQTPPTPQRPTQHSPRPPPLSRSPAPRSASRINTTSIPHSASPPPCSAAWPAPSSTPSPSAPRCWCSLSRPQRLWGWRRARCSSRRWRA
jgi:hypothetical protein